jgi:Na+-translocating ferredoxin:NAD+ oxidoreductase RNF subunit RnfB
MGIVFALWLIFAQRLFAVKQDPKIEHIFSLLPGSNCGVCGRAGCHGLAEALARGEVKDIICPVVHEKEREEIADILGIKVAERTKEIATLICGGGVNCKDKFVYQGPKDCRTADLIFGAHKACNFGCIGFGTCMEACPFKAISMGEDNLPRIDPEKCTGCGKCVKMCPKGVLVLTPENSEFHIYCNSKDKGADVTRACKTGCIGCGKCVRECPVQAITLKDNLASIDYTKCINCGKCIKVCPTKAIIRREKDVKEYSRNQ